MQDRTGLKNPIKEAISAIFTKRNAIYAAALTVTFSAGSHFGFEQYENRLESREMETLHSSENIHYPTRENGSVDWDKIKGETVKLMTFDFDN